jgi:hypothetical protein
MISKTIYSIVREFGQEVAACYAGSLLQENIILCFREAGKQAALQHWGWKFIDREKLFPGVK